MPLNRLLVLGINILIASALLVVYGLLIGDSGLVGIGLSTSILGGVLAIYSTIPQDPSLVALANYSNLLVNAVTSTLEDLDLLEPQICAIKRSDSTLLVYSKIPCPLEVDPGIGFSGGSPYLAIPVNIPTTLYEASGESTSTLLERSLTAVLVEEFSACKSVRVEEESGQYIVYITGLAEVPKQFLEKPLDPYTLLVLTVSSSVLDATCVKLINRRVMPDGILLVLRAEKSGAED
jgi:hypothetical protein